VDRRSWSRLNKQQVGRFAEYFVKMEFARYGFEIYTSEVDDRGIDFVVRHDPGGFREVQVKSVRESKYVFMHKSVFPLSPRRVLALVTLVDGEEPQLYLIPATAWRRPSALLVSRDYKGLKSVPEWGIALSKRSAPLLAQYRFGDCVQELAAE